ncbi:MAG: aldehyde ferredoxin oxidoreductase family protein [Candidatus Odinarchaeota archaeon]|nr:aldehyde ferredoxin oxidoreductase family protein [Candidatus Odinarchaeota archaeon]
MKGWTGKVLRIDLSKKKYAVQEISYDLAKNYVGGRGFAIKILWDELKPGTDPLSPDNKLILASGPLNGITIPNAGKMVVAAKSPLTGGYGDGNIGTWTSIHMRKAGYDAIIIDGASDKPTYIYIEDEKVDFLDASEIWGLGTYETEKKLMEEHGKNVGTLLIGPAGENLIKYATIRSMEGRSGGRPGMGAVMGSKKLKAIVIRGTKEVSNIAEPEKVKEMTQQLYKEIQKAENYEVWMRQGTMLVHAWCQENSVLPTYNFREGVFEDADKINGDAMERVRVKLRGCPLCNMQCGHTVLELNGMESELDYENVGMLGSNIGLGDLTKVATLNRLADEYGIDTISLGSNIAFAMEASEKGLIDEKIEWGDFEKAKELTRQIVYKEGLGALLADGVKVASEKIGHDSKNWAMHVKGLEISAYDCHYAPAMALAYGTSPIGAHHKDAWVITWDVKTGRDKYVREKVEKVIEFQRIRGGLFESIVACRLPWIELGISLEWYPRFLTAVTGTSFTLDDMFTVADRIYSLIRAFWIREYGGNWGRHMDTPPARWFKEPLTKGPFAGKHLDPEGYEKLLSMYYEIRGWNEQGIPKRSTLEKLGLSDVAAELEKYVKLE